MTNSDHPKIPGKTNRVRIELVDGQSKLFDADTGDEIRHVYKYSLIHEVGDVPRISIECWLTVDAVLEGKLESRVIMCPCCKKEMTEGKE